jgi:hypothetical protein
MANAINLLAIIDHAGMLKQEIADKSAKLKELNEIIEASCDFSGSKTANLFGGAFKVKVQAKTTIKWDQDALENLRNNIGDAEFTKVFKWKYEHASAKDLDGAVKYGAFADQIRECYTETKASSTFTFEALEG